MRNILFIIVISVISILTNFSCQKSNLNNFDSTKLAQVLLEDFVKKGNGYFIKKNTLGNKKKWRVFLYPQFLDKETYFRFVSNESDRLFSDKYKGKLSKLKISIPHIHLDMINLIPFTEIIEKDYNVSKDLLPDLIESQSSGVFLISRPFIKDENLNNMYNILVTFFWNKNMKTIIYTFEVDSRSKIKIVDTKYFNPHLIH